MPHFWSHRKWMVNWTPMIKWWSFKKSFNFRNGSLCDTKVLISSIRCMVHTRREGGGEKKTKKKVEDVNGVEIRGAWKTLDMTTHIPPYYISRYIECMGVEPKKDICQLQNCVWVVHDYQQKPRIFAQWNQMNFLEESIIGPPTSHQRCISLVIDVHVPKSSPQQPQVPNGWTLPSSKAHPKP